MAATTADAAQPRRLPGVDGVWVFLAADLVIFALLFMGFMQERQRDPGMFEASRQTLNMHLGGIDTLILLTSSWLVALAVQAIKRDRLDQAPVYLFGGALTGLMFVGSKSTEYFLKFAEGITPGTNLFYMWYFTLTGIHLVHVLVGTALLTVVWLKARQRIYRNTNRTFPESVASYWHLVDLLWIMLFPLLYLLKAA